MQPDGPSSPHLTYCTNIHPGESWETVRENFDRYILPVREMVAPQAPFGVGLRLSAEAAAALAQPEALAEFRSYLAQHGLYIFTINGFPYGPFHGQPVKEDVYLPNWMQQERLDYTNRLADLLDALLPDGIRGTISTVPGAFAPLVRNEEDAQRIAILMARHAAHLHSIHQRTGRHIALAIEPEPCCHLETVADTVAFFRDHLFSGAAADAVVAELGISAASATQILHEHLTVCFDACHMAVEFDDAAEALATFREAGITIGKFQISAGLQVAWTGVPEEDASLRESLASFSDPVYLHQVVERRPDGELRRFLDLPEALEATDGDREPREWRIHFHVPLFRDQLGPFRSTQGYLKELIGLLDGGDADQHWEVETYTWDVLPEEYRAGGVVADVARELQWVIDEMRSARARR